MKIKILLIALLFSVVGYGQRITLLGEPQGNISIGMKSMMDNTTGTAGIPLGLAVYGRDAINQPTGFTNAAPVIEYGTCVYLNRNDKIQIAKQATRSTYTEYMEDGPLLIASQEITYKSKYGINIPEDAVIIFKIKPKK